MVDGTKCGENKWCFQKKCIEAGQRPRAVNGGWGDWGAPTQCSRSCGGGVTMSERNCNNPTPANGGRYCSGERQKFWICNTKPCPIGGPTFRDVQCAEGNTNSREGPWRGYFKEDEPCVLFCINDNSLVRKLQPRTKNGTPCKAGTKYTCISGVCTKVGCDFIIDSDAVDDICGICNGDGTECQIVEQYFNDTGQDYQEVTTFPANSRNILVEELGKSPNIIALKDKSTNLFILNGDHKESADITFAIDRTEAIYRHPEPDKEVLVIKGPLALPKVLYVCFFKPANIGYKYRYAKMITDGSKIGMYHWEVLEFEKCSANCEGGIQEAIIGCVEEKGGKVSPKFCKHVKRITATAKKCNEHACPRRWRVGKWGRCHACEFQSGIRTRRVECVKESPHPGAEETLVDEKECDGVRPASRELCNAVKVCRCRRKTTLGLSNRKLRDVWKQIKDAVRRGVEGNKESDNLHDTENKILNCEMKADEKVKLTESDALDNTLKIPDKTSKDEKEDSLNNEDDTLDIPNKNSKEFNEDITEESNTIDNPDEMSIDSIEYSYTTESHTLDIPDTTSIDSTEYSFTTDTLNKKLDILDEKYKDSSGDSIITKSDALNNKSDAPNGESSDSSEESVFTESDSLDNILNIPDEESKVSSEDDVSTECLELQKNIESSTPKVITDIIEEDDSTKSLSCEPTKNSRITVDITTEAPCKPVDFEESVECEKTIKVNVGDIVIDKKDTNGALIIEVPFKETSLTVNASDSAFEDLGDQLGDTLLTDHTKTVQGKDARTEIEKIRHKLKHPRQNMDE
ncbi:hypothetical protein HHI36_013735 [Cryptolaemus montrouzieri]